MGKILENIPLSGRPSGLSVRQQGAKQGVFQRPKWFLSRFISRIYRVPAAQAVLVQLVALTGVFLGVLAVDYVIPLRFTIFSLVLTQALFATGLCILVGMASWWRWIHFGFPVALWGISMWHVPNEIYLAGFLVSLGLFWTTFRSQVPFFPSRPIIWEKVSEIIPQEKPIRMVDIGSGLGDLVMHIANTRPHSRIEGIEIAPLPWLVSKLRAWKRRSKAIFALGNYQDLDFGRYDVVFAYLSPAAMPALWEKAHQEMRQGSLLISYEFEIPGVAPSFNVASEGRVPMIYVWKI